MFWALARVSFRAAKIVSCNKIFFFMVYDQNYHNCSTLDPPNVLQALNWMWNLESQNIDIGAR
jgi:hypothetical protein